MPDTCFFFLWIFCLHRFQKKQQFGMTGTKQIFRVSSSQNQRQLKITSHKTLLNLQNHLLTKQPKGNKENRPLPMGRGWIFKAHIQTIILGQDDRNFPCQTALPKPVYQHQGKIKKKKKLSWKIRCKCIQKLYVSVFFFGWFFSTWPATWLNVTELAWPLFGLLLLTFRQQLCPATLPAQHPQWRHLSDLSTSKWFGHPNCQIITQTNIYIYIAPIQICLFPPKKHLHITFTPSKATNFPQKQVLRCQKAHGIMVDKCLLFLGFSFSFTSFASRSGGGLAVSPGAVPSVTLGALVLWLSKRCCWCFHQLIW